MVETKVPATFQPGVIKNDQIVVHGEASDDSSHESPTQLQFLGIESAKDGNMYMDNNNGDNLYNIYIKLSEGIESSHHPGKGKKDACRQLF